MSDRKDMQVSGPEVAEKAMPLVEGSARFPGTDSQCRVHLLHV